MLKYLMESKSLLITRSSTCFSQRWIAFKHKFSWNLIFRIFRILFVATLCFGFAWLFIKKDILLPKLPKITNIVINQNEENLINFTLSFSNIQKHYKMEKPKIEPCNGKQIKLLVLVISRRELLQRRMGIRYSWGKDASKNMLIRYVIGGPTEGEEDSEKLDKILNKEQEQFGDLILYFNLAEGYDQLQFKIGVAFQWQQKWCSNAEFVMKIDDDSLIDLPRWDFWIEKKFKKQLKEVKNGMAFFGHLFNDNSPIRAEDNKWYVSEKEFPNKVYPNHMHGSGYFATGKAITSIMKHTKEAYAIHIEDALWSGILAEKGNVTRVNHGHDHFLDATLEEKEKCEHGKPIIFCLFQMTLSSTKEYKSEYKRLHDLKCK
ncbi:hypothetical protein ACQ4LE_009777 [Meloidogyne hapla]